MGGGTDCIKILLVLRIKERMAYLGVDDHEPRQPLLPEALPQGRDLVEGARGCRRGVGARLVGKIHALVRDGVTADAPVPVDGPQEALYMCVCTLRGGGGGGCPQWIREPSSRAGGGLARSCMPLGR